MPLVLDWGTLTFSEQGTPNASNPHVTVTTIDYTHPPPEAGIGSSGPELRWADWTTTSPKRNLQLLSFFSRFLVFLHDAHINQAQSNTKASLKTRGSCARYELRDNFPTRVKNRRDRSGAPYDIDTTTWKTWPSLILRREEYILLPLLLLPMRAVRPSCRRRCLRRRRSCWI